ncbi:IS200/IS605 family element transposase accessory protein TnpB [Infirmifilum lucidum]|uniref:IS200/IS605 family element transposase accessory protein TnpB n=1 Tax=Infirmifilum lucidum TaxID=2776706 RepID=A0A7L9FH25_9CREN|nr:RNA-guided endonuclease TnpB family protein [Infirmifilum lucidum]QOJ78931.1 IS200/IS605 family element transposase accessory protein TnpB [Infirmifilum lucidum]
MHRGVYEALKERYGLPSKMAQDCYRHAIAVYKGWLRNPHKGEFPTVRRRAVWLAHKYSYWLKGGVVHIAAIGDIPVIGRPGHEMQYADWEPGDAVLTVREDGVFLHVPKAKAVPPIGAKDAVGVDVNYREVAAATSMEDSIRLETRIEDAVRVRRHAEALQRRHGRSWRRRHKVLARIRKLYKRSRNILLDAARKIGKKVAEYALERKAKIRMEDLNGLKRRAQGAPKEWRLRLAFLAYREIQHWIAHQARKRGVPVEYVPPGGTSSRCPVDGHKLAEASYRTLRCPKCGLAADRDLIAALNIRMGGLLTAPTALPLTDEAPTEGGNLPARGTPAL